MCDRNCRPYDCAARCQLVIDERGRNVISLLSGHIGGANDLTLKIAAQIDANPVITTATDVEEKFSADDFAARSGLLPIDKNLIKAVNSAILRGEEIFITAGNVRLDLTPRNLICGIGCKRGTSIEKISRAVETACKMINQPVERIKIFATVDIKRDEKNLIDFVNKLGRDIKFFSVDELNEKVLNYKLAESDFVKKNIGVGNVCEAAALSIAHGKFALPKTKFDSVTIALLWEDVEVANT